MSANLYRCKPRLTREFIQDILEADCVPNVISSPGMGKSSIIKSVADTYNLDVIDHRLSTSAPEDLSGLPEFRDKDIGEGQTIRVATFTPFDIFPIRGTPLPNGKDGWLLFFDEFNSGSKSVQAACYKTILDKMVGQAHLHDRVKIACAGNLATDRAITNDLSTAMQSRMVHIEMQLDFVEWLEDVALPQNWDPRITAYLNHDNNELMDFRPDHQDKSFNCPRTWEFMNRLIKGKEVSARKTGLYAGTISSGSAAKFVSFVEICADMIDIKAVLANPTGIDLPWEPEKKWQIVTHLMSKITDENFGKICEFINRLDLSFKILFFRGALVKFPTLRSHPSFVSAMVELSKYLKGTPNNVPTNPA